MSLTLNFINIEEKWLSFAQQQSNVNRSSCGIRASWPPGCWEFMAWECEGIVHAVTINVNSYAHPTFCVWKMLLPWSHLPVTALTNFVFLLHRCLSLEEWGMVDMSHLWSNIPMTSLNHCVFQIINCSMIQKKLLCFGLSSALFYG